MDTRCLGHAVVRCCRDVQLKELGEKKVKVANFGVVWNERTKTAEGYKETPHYFDAEAWDTGAEYLAKHLKKGDALVIDFIIRENRWEKDGEKRSKTTFRIEKFNIIPNIPKAPVAAA